ncbi:MAG: PaaI family thioesterase [Bdellovibrionota bacterium]
MNQSLQMQYAPTSRCFGCGPANDKGLRIQSFVDGDRIKATFLPQEHHQAFEGVINGGIIGSLLDCHCNWAASYFLMKEKQLTEPPCTVTAEYKIQLLAPTPKQELTLDCGLVRLEGSKAWIEGHLSVQGKITATCEGLFVAVKPGHPAYHRW